MNGRHATTFIPIIIAEARGHELTGGARQKKISEFFWQTVIDHYTFAIGGIADREHFFAPDNLSAHMTARSVESCMTYYMLKLSKHLFAWSGDVKYADYYERALYNHILASQDPVTGGMCYYMSHKPGQFKVYGTQYDSFWCCMGTGIENHSKYGEAIYFHDDDGLYVNLFIPSVLNWKEKGVKVRQETTYPNSDKTRLTVESTNGKEFPIRVRHPSWAVSGVTLTINGNQHPVNDKPGSYIELNRKWQKDDVIEVTYPMSLRLVPANDNPNLAAIAYGPIVLAGAMGKDGIKEPYVKWHSELENYKVPDDLVTTIRTHGEEVSKWVKPVAGAEPLTFKVVNQSSSKSIKLIPYNRLSHQRYVIYWNLDTKDQ